MASPTLRTRAGIVATAAFDAAASGIWLLAGELPPRRRRLARAGLTLTVMLVGIGVDRTGLIAPAADADADRADDDEAADDDDLAAAEQGQPDLAEELAEEAGGTEPGPPNPAVGLAIGGVAVAIMIGASALQKRWLAGLERSGHAHPHRALALRVAAVSFAGTLATRLTQLHESGAAADRSP